MIKTHQYKPQSLQALLPSQFSAYHHALADDSIWLIEDFYLPAEAAKLYVELEQEITWRRDSVKMFGKTHPIPRLHAFYGDADLQYRYSAISLQAQPWSPCLHSIREQLQEKLQLHFNSVLCNCYRNGRDSNGWHADDEPELGARPVLASLSFGAARDFQFKHRHSDQRRQLALPAGSLLLMGDTVQENWLHCVPKRLRCNEPRINLTFRNIVA